MTHTPHRLELENVSIGYGDKIVLRDLTFNIPHGARVAVVGNAEAPLIPEVIEGYAAMSALATSTVHRASRESVDLSIRRLSVISRARS